MHGEFVPDLRPRRAGRGQVVPLPSGDGWRLMLRPAEGGYHLAQLDDYTGLPRRAFHQRPPVTLELEARLWPEDPPGTWGFGFWNDPFLVLGGAERRLPAGPQALWFFGASPPNHLSLHPRVPARGFFAGVTAWEMPRQEAPLLPLVALAAWLPPLRGWARERAGRWLRQWGVALPRPGSRWRRYTLQWEPHRVRFWMDGAPVGETRLVPRAPLGLVLWVDNQYAAWPPEGPPRWGVLPIPQEVVLEVRSIRVAGAAR